MIPSAQNIERVFDCQSKVSEKKHIRADDLIYIGKETNNIEYQPLNVTKPQIFQDLEEIKQNILALIPEEARKIGIIHRDGLGYLKENTRRKVKF